MTTKKPATPQVPALPGVTPLGLPPAPCESPKRRRRLFKMDVESRVSMVKEREILDRPDVVDGARAAARILCPLIGNKPKEHFVVIALNARREPLGVVTVSMGTLSASLVHPREVFAPAILLNAAAIVVSHNHPSGDPSPSSEDRDATRRLQRAGELLGIPLADHVIVGGPDAGSMGDGRRAAFFSFREAGLL